MILSLRRAEYSILEIRLPAQKPAPFGVLLIDPESDHVYQRFREDVAPDADDAELLAALPEDLAAKAREMGGEKLLAWFEDSLSNTLRISDRHSTVVRNFENALDRLYHEHVAGEVRERAPVVPFVTHVPLYSLRAAAGRFGQDMEVEPEDWVNVPSGVRASPEIYAVHVAGRSMEPEIPDGSIAIFARSPPARARGNACWCGAAGHRAMAASSPSRSTRAKNSLPKRAGSTIASASSPSTPNTPSSNSTTRPSTACSVSWSRTRRRRGVAARQTTRALSARPFRRRN